MSNFLFYDNNNLLSQFIYNRSIGLHREAEMIEQQLKMKQSTGQLTMAPGKFFFLPIY